MELPYFLEDEYLSLARVRIAQGRDDPESPFLQEVLRLLDRLLRDAEAKARQGSVLEILVLRALALDAQGNRTSALSTLDLGLVLAEPEGYIRLFVDEGAPMLALLRQAQAHSTVPGYIATLLAAFGEAPPADRSSSASGSERLLEPLTEREREILAAVARGERSKEIGLRLGLTKRTVETYLATIYNKLGVDSRAAAVAIALEYHLLPWSTPSP